MANRLKKKTAAPPPPDPEKLQPEKEVQVTVKEVVKDERTSKIAGAVSLLIAIFLFVAFTSYIFTWQEDQDKVFQFGIKIFAVDDVKVNNLMGVLGAYVAHNIIYKGFGLASYLFCTTFFVFGINLLFGKKVFSIVRNIKYLVIGLLVLSVALSFFTHGSSFSWGGGVGELMDMWLVKWIGSVGTGALLVICVLSYVIWRFNPTFKLPSFSKPKAFQQPAMASESAKLVIDEDVLKDEEDIAMHYQEEDAPVSNNKLKEGAGVVVIMPKNNLQDEAIPFDIVEKDLETEHASQSEDVIDNPTGDLDLLVDENGKDLVEDEPVAKPEDEIVEEKTAETIELNVAKATVQKRPELKRVYDDEIDMELEIQNNPEEAEDAEEENDVKENKLHKTIDEVFDPTEDLSNYEYPQIELLEAHGSEKIVHDPQELEANKNQIIATLKNYDIAIQRIAATVGPTVTLYEIVPAPGVRISRIKNLEDDIALSLAALGIRIIAPIPGKGTIGIEVPNVRKTVVSMKTLLASDKFQNNGFSLPIAIGKKIDNENFIVDLAAMPHLLMAGATGQGKSVGINTLLVSLLYKKHPSQLKFVLVDPKKVELSLYRVIEKHFLAKLPGEEESIITDTKKVINTLNALCIEMDNRYDLLKEAGCRNIKEYNEKFTKRKLNPNKGHQYLPFIVLVVDEFADLIMTAGKEVEMPIARLAQLARAIGIHLIIATQRPSVNIITGTIKANFPARIAFKVSSKIDSRTILDAGGAEQLIGKGDMLISYNGEITRLQCAFVDTPEVEKVCEFIGEQRGYPQAFLLPEYVDEKDAEGKDFDLSDRDPLFEDAARLIVANQVGSTSLIQRKMKLGYNRAGRLMDQLEAAGIVGPNLGSKAREVQVKTDSELQEILDMIG
jgi:S-DNA-T family DNA segregation ATPase FtsK/SpoIIIE